jgi:predicted kinase
VKPLLVVVSGPPGAGKTTLAKRLGAEAGLPVLSRDDIKGAIFDSLGWSDREWSIRVGRASYDLLHLFAERLVSAGASVVVESNFDRSFLIEQLAAMRTRMRFRVIEINCSAEPSTLARRFRERWDAGARHPGHTDVFTDEETFLAALSDRDFGPATVESLVIEVDTNDFDKIDWDEIVSVVREAIGGTDGSRDC